MASEKHQGESAGGGPQGGATTMQGAPSGPITDELFRQVLEEHVPFNKHLGMKLGAVDRERLTAEIVMTVGREHVGNSARGMPHGGVLATLIDAASGAAAALTLSDAAELPTLATVDMRVDFLRPAKGRALTAVGRVIRSGKSVVVVRTEVRDGTGELVALGASTFMVDRGV